MPIQDAMSVLAGDPVREWILQEGGATVIQRISPIGGGCISAASRYDTDAGPFFVKSNRRVMNFVCNLKHRGPR